MKLELTIVEAPDDIEMTEWCKTFDNDTEGTVGRATDNSWVLPDPERVVSSKHATVAFVNGVFMLTDHSTNGTFINGDLRPLGSGKTTPLQDGDTLTLGPYRLRVSLSPHGQPAAKDNARPVSQLPSESIPQIQPAPKAQEPVDAKPLMPPPAEVTDSMANTNLAQALGLQDLTADQQQVLADKAADVLRESVHCLMELLSARASIKNELRVERTMIKPTGNNPLKFSPNTETALTTLFGKENTAFIPPVEAIKESFDDISNHQVAILVGMKAAFDAMLSQFDPSRLEQQFSHQENRSLLKNKQAKLWEAYKKHFRQLQDNKDASYRKLFGDAFAEAYELQLTILKGHNKESATKG